MIFGSKMRISRYLNALKLYLAVYFNVVTLFISIRANSKSQCHCISPHTVYNIKFDELKNWQKKTKTLNQSKLKYWQIIMVTKKILSK